MTKQGPECSGVGVHSIASVSQWKGQYDQNFFKKDHFTSVLNDGEKKKLSQVHKDLLKKKI